MLLANAPGTNRWQTWLAPFEASFGHVAPGSALCRYLVGPLRAGPRWSVSAMLPHVTG